MLSRFHPLRHYLLVAIMALTLVGVQLAQSSPLHNHAQHSVDCALCHLQLGDALPVRSQLQVSVGPISATAVPSLPPFHADVFPSPYQGRAPPVLFS